MDNLLVSMVCAASVLLPKIYAQNIEDNNTDNTFNNGDMNEQNQIVDSSQDVNDTLSNLETIKNDQQKNTDENTKDSDNSDKNNSSDNTGSQDDSK